MNERILQLAKQCGYWSGQTIEMNDVGIEKFAELIVQEFIKIADDEASRFYNMNEDDCASAMLNYMELIKQRFGVK